MTEAIKQTNREKIRTLGEKETYKYLGLWEADVRAATSIQTYRDERKSKTPR